MVTCYCQVLLLASIQRSNLVTVAKRGRNETYCFTLKINEINVVYIISDLRTTKQKRTKQRQPPGHTLTMTNDNESFQYTVQLFTNLYINTFLDVHDRWVYDICCQHFSLGILETYSAQKHNKKTYKAALFSHSVIRKTWHWPLVCIRSLNSPILLLYIQTSVLGWSCAFPDTTLLYTNKTENTWEFLSDLTQYMERLWSKTMKLNKKEITQLHLSK